ncbi:arylsulfatase G isoform X3 [Tachysurus fulvidraco]|uniref:arylsulfatase G isoform X3 n=1 Tax=Tachysurus fulvidraco TaxID=1234273 RepID=UPI000F4F4F1D|nr:arylsulfatase G isoform X3 [Tachysurus fulvidraco]
MVEAGACVLLLFCSLFSGLVYYRDFFWEHENKVTTNEKPNFIIILADDIGWGDILTNESDNTTPWLNMLKLEGKRFTDFHSPASTCSPSRAALLTGRHGLRNGVTHNFAKGSVGGLPLNETTFAQLLRDAGYYTAMIGKWHLGHSGFYHPISRGFEYYLGIPYSNDMGCTDKPGFDLPSCSPCEQSKHSSRKDGGCDAKTALPLFENQTIVEQPLDLWALTEKYAKASVTQILTARNKGKPFLLYVALAHMHVPLFHNCFLNVTAKEAYSASLSDMDSLVGRIKQAIDTFRIENTLIWFTGDNGPWEQKCEFAGSTGPFQGKWQTSRGGGSAKRTTWEGGHRVPSVVVWPGKISPNTTSNALLSGMDIFPTILSLAGVDPPSDRHYDGIDVVHILLNESDTGHKSLMHPNSGAAGQFGDLQTVRVGHYKAFYITGGAEACRGGSGKQELHDPPLIFNLDTDEAEGSPLDPASEEYQLILKEVEREREELLWDIATDNVSTADYTVSQSAVPCCQPQNPACRCHRRERSAQSHARSKESNANGFNVPKRNS